MLDTMSCVGVGVWVTRLQDLSRQRALEDFSLVVDSTDGWTFRDMHADFWLPLKAPHESSSVSDATINLIVNSRSLHNNMGRTYKIGDSFPHSIKVCHFLYTEIYQITLYYLKKD
jgi:hypothetical protein